MSSETSSLEPTALAASLPPKKRPSLWGARHRLRKNVHQQKECVRNAGDLNGIKETRIYTVSEEIPAPAPPSPAKDTEREPAPVEKPTASPGSPGGRNYSPSEKPLIPEFGPLEHALYELQSCPSKSTRINVSLRREGEQQNVAVNSRIKAMPAMMKGPDEKTRPIPLQEFGPLERILRELRNYSTPIQSMNIDASFYRKGSERKITIQSKTSDLLPEKYSVPSSTEANKFWKPWTWGPGVSLTAVVSLALAGYVASYFLSGRIADPLVERISQHYYQERSPSQKASDKNTLKKEQEPALQRKPTSPGVVNYPALEGEPAAVVKKNPDGKSEEGQCLKSFRQLYNSPADSSDTSTPRQTVKMLLAACREPSEISQVLTAGKEKPDDNFNFPEAIFNGNDYQDKWKSSFRELFGEKALLYSGEPDTFQYAVHLGYTSIRLPPILREILQQAGISTDKEFKESVAIKEKTVVVEKSQLNYEERKRLALIPRLEAVLFSGKERPVPPVVKIFTTSYKAREAGSNIAGYYDSDEPKAIYLRRDQLWNDENFIRIYLHERGHQITKGSDHQDIFRDFFENLSTTYLSREVQRKGSQRKKND